MIRIISGSIAALSTIAGEIVIRRKKACDARTTKLIERLNATQTVSASLFCASFLF